MNEFELLKLYCLLHHHYIELDQLKHEFALYDEHAQPKAMGVMGVLKALQSLAFDARLRQGSVQSLRASSLPALLYTTVRDLNKARVDVVMQGLKLKATTGSLSTDDVWLLDRMMAPAEMPTQLATLSR